MILAGSAKTVGGRLCYVNVTGTYSAVAAQSLKADSLEVTGSGVLTVNGATVTTLTDLFTTGSGKLNMTNAADSVFIAADAGFHGGASSLTNGKLVIGANFDQSVNNSAFVAGANHTTYFVNANPPTVSFSDPTGSFGKLVITQGTLDVNSIVNTVSHVYLQGSATLSGSGHLKIGGNFYGGPLTSVNTEAIEVVGVFSDTGGTNFMPDTLIFSGSGQLIPNSVGATAQSTVNYNNLVVSGSARAWSDSTYFIGGGVIIPGIGTLRIGNAGHTTTFNVDDSLVTTNAGKLQMSDSPTDTLFVNRGVHFGGGSTYGLLTKGRLWIAGDFLQDGASSQAFSAASTFTTQFAGSSRNHISFQNPDSLSSGSHFGALDFCNSESGSALTTDVYAVGQLTRLCQYLPVSVLRDPAIAVGSYAPTLTVTGANVTATSDTTYLFDRVKVAIADGTALTAFDNVAFSEFFQNYSGETQLTVKRSSGTFTFDHMVFNTDSTSTYLYLVANGAFTLNLTNASPTNSYSVAVGKTSTLGGATLNWTP
jgi:hypothetical protein